MFQVNDDNSIYVTRGDMVYLKITCNKDGKPYTFQPGEVIRFNVCAKKNCDDVVLQKDFPVTAVTQGVEIVLDGEDTKIGGVISKPTDYWYEVVLNPLDIPQTIIGYDEEGTRVFRLYPEANDKPAPEPKPEVIKTIDTELDMSSERPVQNQAIARAFENLKAGYLETHKAVAELHVTPEMFGAIGDGVADDTEALKMTFTASKRVVIKNGTYLISDTIDIESDTVIEINNAKLLSKATENKKYIFNIAGKDNIKIYGDNATLEMSKPSTSQQACVAIFDAHNILIDGLKLTKAGGDGIIIGGGTAKEAKDIFINNCIIDNSRRNGISIVGAVDNVKIQNCIIKNTSGAEPQLGIDIETWSPELVNKNIEISHCRFENNTNGSVTVFEYTNGVKLHDNYCDNTVSVKVNDQYASVSEAIPTNIEMYNNTFKGVVYFFRILDGVFAVNGNVFDGTHITIDSSISINANEATKNAPAKTICNNVFNDCETAIYIGNNANITVTDNVINNCTLFLNLYGLCDSVVSGNIVNGYNAYGTWDYCCYIFGVIKNLDIHDNIIKQPSGEKSVKNLFYIAGGSVERLRVHHNNFENALFTKVISYDAIGSNIDYANATSTRKNHTETLCSPCEYLAGTIVTVEEDGVLVPKICVKDGTSYGWRTIDWGHGGN